MRKPNLAELTFISFCFNLFFAGYHALLGLINQSWWLITLGVYYTILTVMRFALLKIRKTGKKEPSLELFAKRFTGVMFIVMSVCLVGTVVLAVVADRGVKHNEIVMITLALYAFTKVTFGIINLIKSKKHHSPALKALRNISFADALVSIFSLQRSMLVTFDGMTAENIRLFNILTGSGVCLMILILGINLIGGKKIDMAKSKLVKANEKIAEAVVGGYKKIEKGVVDGYTKIEDKFVDAYLTKDGETVEEAKARLKGKNK